MKLHVLRGGHLEGKGSVFLPGIADSSPVLVPVMCFLIRHPQGNVLFDTGCHPSVAVDAHARWHGLERSFKPRFAPGEDVVGDLRRIGLEPEDVDLVVNSHLHMDHCGANEFFTKATVAVHEKELATAKDPKSEGQGYFREDWDHPMKFDVLTDERDVFGDGKVVLIPAPGHTPGTTVALVRLGEAGEMLLTSDAVIVRANLERDIVPRNTWDPETLLGSFAKIRKIQSGGATVVFGHDPEQWTTLKKGEDAYL